MLGTANSVMGFMAERAEFIVPRNEYRMSSRNLKKKGTVQDVIIKENIASVKQL